MKFFDQLMQRGNTERDSHLKTAFSCVPGRSYHLRVIEFSRRITRFETFLRKNQGQPPRRLGPFGEALLKARQANGGPLPTCEYELAKILYSGDGDK